jgi:hypothetical protein
LNTYIVTWSPIVSLNPLTSHYSPVLITYC